MKVYVIMAGEYSDRHIERVFDDKDKAHIYANIRNDNEAYDTVHVEEYETTALEVKPDYTPYTVMFDMKGCVKEARRDPLACDFNNYSPRSVSVLTSDIDHAIKIARDLKAQYEAEKLGIGV